MPPTDRAPRVLYVQYTNPAGYPPLEHSSRMLADAGADVLFLGTGAFGAGSFCLPPHPAIRCLQFGNRWGRVGQRYHFLLYCLWAFVRALWFRPDWVYASDLYSTPLAVALSIMPGMEVVYHEHDSPEGVPGSRVMAMLMRSRRGIARRAAVCVLPNERRVEAFTDSTGSHAVAVYNCPLSTEAASGQPDGPQKDHLDLLYHGSIVKARLPEALIEALALVGGQVTLRIIGYETIGSRGHVERLQQIAARLGVSAQLHVIGALPTRSEVLEWCRKSDVGLALMPIGAQSLNERTMAGASNKAFDCLGSGMPIIVSDLPDWRAMFVDAGYAKACDPGDPRSIATALRWYLTHPEERRRMGASGQARVRTEWNYEAQFRPVFDVMMGQHEPAHAPTAPRTVAL